MPPCSAYDDLRNGIHAWYGYPFGKAEWRERFEPFPWYQRREDFDASWLSPVAAANVDKLKQLKADKVGCED